ncbi:MAG: fructose-6-phosphate aldolase [Propionibacteriaceae bacterium]|jgi:TalC/MipB family fructose-6-phosphate aldolase|nr:fructose-6-phosphate aldolase [Propionibacteriaceae bacterium]
MEYLFDTINKDDIERFGSCFPYTGVTSNPSILKMEAQGEPVLQALREIRQVIGFGRTLHIQVVARDRNDIVAEAESLMEKVDDQVYVKVPTTEEGLAAMQMMKQRGIRITATTVYTKVQGFMAIAVGADFIAPYYNRVADFDVDPKELVSSLAKVITKHNAPTKILAASFKNITQVNDALMAGAHCVTVQPRLLHAAYGAAAIQRAVDDFTRDWQSVAGDVSITDL